MSGPQAILNFHFKNTQKYLALTSLEPVRVKDSCTWLLQACAV